MVSLGSLGLENETIEDLCIKRTHAAHPGQFG